MAKKKGICRNEECEMYGQEFIQEADEFNFVCEKCGEPLLELPKKRTWWDEHGKQVMIGAAALIVIGGGVAGVSALMGGDEKVPQNPPVEKVEKNDTVAAKDTAKTVEATSETTNEEKKPETQPETKQKEDPKPITRGQDKQPQGGYGTINLGYGKYTGALKNGKPEGQGRIVYTQSHRIAKYDPKERVAMPGESVSGVFHNGEITIGKYFDANGKLIESLNIGSVD